MSVVPPPAQKPSTLFVNFPLDLKPELMPAFNHMVTWHYTFKICSVLASLASAVVALAKVIA